MWTIGRDVAWIRVDAKTYRHYCGASVIKRGRLWIGQTVAGQSISSRATAAEAILKLIKADPLFWIFGQYGTAFGVREFGNVRHSTRPVFRGDSDEVFTFSCARDEAIPSFVISILKRSFFGNALCVKCMSPMSGIRILAQDKIDGRLEDKNLYISCVCGYPVWRMEMDSYQSARIQLERIAANWRRAQRLKAAGGKHTRSEIERILAFQGNRCIYCNERFTQKRRPSCDHILPLTRGGGDWALNIVMACRRCNSSRGNIPFRTFCKLLSSTQNKRIRVQLRDRLLAIDFDRLPTDAFACFTEGLSLHEPSHWRFRDIQRWNPRARSNASANHLLPRSALGILRQAI